jgi:hypothetical protein
MARTVSAPARLRDLLASRAIRLSKSGLQPGDIVVADPFAHAVIRVAPTSGVQTVLFHDPTFAIWSLAVSGARILLGGNDYQDGRAKVVAISSGGATRQTVVTFGRPGGD